MKKPNERLKNGSGNLVKIAQESFDEGGEGAIFEWRGHTDHVVKVYKKPASETKADKLREMVKRKDAELLSFTAWPQDILLQQDGKVRGFIMGFCVKRFQKYQ